MIEFPSKLPCTPFGHCESSGIQKLSNLEQFIFLSASSVEKAGGLQMSTLHSDLDCEFSCAIFARSRADRRRRLVPHGVGSGKWNMTLTALEMLASAAHLKPAAISSAEKPKRCEIIEATSILPSDTSSRHIGYCMNSTGTSVRRWRAVRICCGISRFIGRRRDPLPQAQTMSVRRIWHRPIQGPEVPWDNRDQANHEGKMKNQRVIKSYSIPIL